MIRNALWRRVSVARDDLDGLMKLEYADANRFDPPRDVVMTRSAWDTAIEDYFNEHDDVLTTGDARGPDLFTVTESSVVEHNSSVVEQRAKRAISRDHWHIRQTIADPEGHHDWVIEAEVDVAASDDLGELVLMTTAMRRL